MPYGVTAGEEVSMARMPGFSVPARGVWALTTMNGEPLVGFKYRVIGFYLYFG